MKVFLILLILLGAIGISLVFPPPVGRILTATPEPTAEKNLPENLLPPDLMIQPPEQLTLKVVGEKRQLRFSTTFANQGQGPLEIIGLSDKNSGLTTATQVIKQTDGGNFGQLAGQIVFHPAHDHWHLGDWAQYQLWSRLPNGQPDQLLAETKKMSFCIFDERFINRELPNAATKRQFLFDCDDERQGLSVGWSDRYRNTIEGQEMDISPVGDGTFIFRSIINPERRIIESDYSNNQIDVVIEIRENRLRRLETK